MDVAYSCGDRLLVIANSPYEVMTVCKIVDWGRMKLSKSRHGSLKFVGAPAIRIEWRGASCAVVNFWCWIGDCFGVLGIKVGLYEYMYKSRTHSREVADVGRF